MEKTAAANSQIDPKQPVSPSLGIASVYQYHFFGESFSKKTLLYLGIISAINFIINAPYLFKDLSPAFTGADAFEGIAYVLSMIGISKAFFYGVIVFFTLIIAPLSYYIFVRRLVLRHEMTAFIAALFFIIPNPFFQGTPIFVHALANGDGAHMVIYAVLPLFLLKVQTFIRSGAPVHATIAAIGTATVTIFAPFAGLNIVIFYLILSIAEGFMGNFRVKIIRCFFLLGISTILTLIWYSPYLMSRAIILDHIKYVITRYVTLAPVIIPAIPIAGIAAYLLFNGRERLKPIFVSISLFIFYISLYIISANLNISGVFTAQRYLPEVAIAESMFFAMTFILVYEFILRNMYPNLSAQAIFRIPLIIKGVGGILILIFTIKGLLEVLRYASMPITADTYSIGVGEIKKTIDITDLTAVIVSFLSVAILIMLVYFLKKYPTFHKKHSTRMNGQI